MYLAIRFAAGKKQTNKQKRDSSIYLGRTLPRDGLAQLAQEGDGGLGGGYQDRLLLRTQVQGVCEQKAVFKASGGGGSQYQPELPSLHVAPGT